MTAHTYRACLKLKRRRPYVWSHPVVFMLGLGGQLAALLLVATGWLHDTRVAEATPAVITYAWVGMTLFGGAMICRGLWTSSPRAEYLGLSLLGTAMVAQVVAVIDTAGSAGTFGATIQGAVAVGLYVRATLLSAQARAARQHERRRAGVAVASGD